MTQPRLFATVASLLGLVVFAAGQDATIQIRAVLQDSAKPDAKFYVGKVGDSLLPLKLAEEGLTDPQKVTTENGVLNLFSSATVDKVSATAHLAATLKIPAGCSRSVVIIVPAAPGALLPYRMVALDDDPASCPWGESKVVNMTPVDFALEIADHKLLLSGGKITAVPKVTKLDEYNRAQTNFYYKQGDQWVIAAERQMQYLNTLRRVFLIYKSPNALAPDVRTIVDQPPALLDKSE
jgi:hypothetical protein